MISFSIIDDLETREGNMSNPIGFIPERPSFVGNVMNIRVSFYGSIMDRFTTESSYSPDSKTYFWGITHKGTATTARVSNIFKIELREEEQELEHLSILYTNVDYPEASCVRLIEDVRKKSWCTII
jgi:hypothetical protein